MTSSTSSTGPVRCGGDGLQARPAFHFDKVALQLAVDFFAKRLRHGEGRWAGHRFTLEPWQCNIIWNDLRLEARRRPPTLHAPRR